MCTPGFTGPNCEIQIDPCQSQPCLNYGICINFNDNYQCHCLPSYNGSRCENDYSTNTIVTCECPTGYLGSNCEIMINQCAYPTNPCGMNGICLPQPQGYLPYSCLCLPGTTGEFFSDLILGCRKCIAITFKYSIK